MKRVCDGGEEEKKIRNSPIVGRKDRKLRGFPQVSPKRGQVSSHFQPRKLGVMNHDKREVFSLTCNNRSFIPIWVKDSSLNLVMFIIILGVGCVMKKKKNQPSQKLTTNCLAAD
jgi:hypothetical protein